MIISLGDVAFESKFQHTQVEITGKCNMRCQHCRAWEESKINMPFLIFKKGIDFVTSESDENFRLTLSGGEPFIHPDLVEFIKYAKRKGIEDIIITTNGSLVNEKILEELDNLEIKNLAIQISIDSSNSEVHDVFRGFKGAFNKAMNSFDLIRNTKTIKSSLRASLTPKTMDEIEPLIQLAIKKGASRIGIGSVIPAGKGKENKELLMTPSQKFKFLDNLKNNKIKYKDLDVTTEDPLKFALDDCPWSYGNFDPNDSALFGGCTAGITGINIDSEGTITPCAVLLKPIVNIKDKSIEEIKQAYSSSEVIKNLYKRDFKKCKSCKLKRLCGGCRAVAEGSTGDYLGVDVTCWK